MRSSKVVRSVYLDIAMVGDADGRTRREKSCIKK